MIGILLMLELKDTWVLDIADRVWYNLHCFYIIHIFK